MRSYWILNVTLLIAAVGCSLPGTQKTAPQGAANQTSWTDKVTAPFTARAPKKKPKSMANAGKTELDPISLGFKSGPTSPALYVSMAQISDQGGNVPHARSMYEKALSMDPKNLDALLGLARLEDREGNLQVALQHYQQAVTNHPKDARPLNDLALCQARSGQMHSSLQCLDQAVRLKPDKQLYRNNIAKVLIELNQFDTAMAHLGAVYEPAVANYNMAALLQERGRTDEAIPFLHNALAANPQLSEASTMLATLTGSAPSAAPATMANGAPGLSTRIAVSAPIATVSPVANYVASGSTLNSPAAGSPVLSSPVNTSAVSNNDVTPTPYVPGETQTVAFSYPSTGVPQMIPMPAQTARVPVGYEPELLPPIR